MIWTKQHIRFAVFIILMIVLIVLVCYASSLFIEDINKAMPDLGALRIKFNTSIDPSIFTIKF